MFSNIHKLFFTFRRWSLTPLWPSWRNSWRRAPSSRRKSVSKHARYKYPEMFTTVWNAIFWRLFSSVLLQKQPKASPVTTQPRSSCTRLGTTPTSPASASSPWPTTWVTHVWLHLVLICKYKRVCEWTSVWLTLFSFSGSFLTPPKAYISARSKLIEPFFNK